MRIAMVGTRGVPAQYGGYETAIEQIGPRLVEQGHQVRVYCRNPEQRQKTYKGMDLINLPATRRKELETLSHTGLSVGHLLTHRTDVALVFNAANAPFLPLLRAARIPVAVHIDGLEWKRAKWAGAGQRYYRAAERWSVALGQAVIADAVGIADHVRETYHHESVFIPYGAEIINPGSDQLAGLDLVAGGYHLLVARFEPENHVEQVVVGYSRSAATKPLVVVGSSPYSDDYTSRVMDAAAGDERVRLLGAVYDQHLLDQLYAGAASYLHGHSVGGTNPSLLRAMGAGAPVTAYDVNFNHEVTGEHARFFSTYEQVVAAVEADEADPDAAGCRGEQGRNRVEKFYRWDSVADDYAALCADLAAGRPLR